MQFSTLNYKTVLGLQKLGKIYKLFASDAKGVLK